MLRKPLRQLIESYARAPYHTGKWRVVDALLRLGGIEEQERGTSTNVERNGLHWSLDPECAVQRRLLYHGTLDVNDSKALLGDIQAGDVFFDVGSYFGYYALSAARRGARSFAFEPVSANFQLLEKHAALNPDLDLTVLPMAVSDQEGEVAFNLPPAGNRGTGAMASDSNPEAVRTVVKAVAIDGFMREHNLHRLDAMKIDVEGAELKVLAGARETLERFRPRMLIEINEPCLARFGESQHTLVDRLKSLRYRVLRVTRRGLEPFVGLEPGEDYANVLCVPEERP